MRKAPAAASFDLNLAPMVDVMMCLLIFFMLATRMVEQEKSRIDLPVARAALEAESSEQTGRLVINLSASPKEDEPTYWVREEKRSRAEVLEEIAAAGRAHPEVNCVIRADRGVPYGHVEAILEGCARAGVSNISFSALRSEGTRP